MFLLERPQIRFDCKHRDRAGNDWCWLSHRVAKCVLRGKSWREVGAPALVWPNVEAPKAICAWSRSILLPATLEIRTVPIPLPVIQWPRYSKDFSVRIVGEAERKSRPRYEF